MADTASLGLRGKKLGVLLATGPDHPNFAAAVTLMRAARTHGVLVYLYCIDDGVPCVLTPEIRELKESGVNLFACAFGAHRRHQPVDETATFSGLTVVSDVVAATDRFLCFS